MKRILVIDDDEDLLELFTIIFSDAGYNVVTSNHIDTAEYIWEIGPDLVLLEVWLSSSQRNGGYLCSAIKQKLGDKRMPIILISGEPAIDRIASSSGADGFVKKPFDVDQLLSKVGSYLS